jgi:hypothetical protein
MHAHVCNVQHIKLNVRHLFLGRWCGQFRRRNQWQESQMIQSFGKLPVHLKRNVMPIIVKDRHFFGHKAIMSAVKKVEFVNDRMSYSTRLLCMQTWGQIWKYKGQILWGTRVAFFDNFPKTTWKMLLGDINAYVWQKDIFRQTIWNESLRNISDDNGVGVVYFATSKCLFFKSAMQCCQ